MSSCPIAYSLIMNVSYNLRQKDISVLHIALHRALSVIVGVVWAAFVSRFWWPAEARRELGKALSEYAREMTFREEADLAMQILSEFRVVVHAFGCFKFLCTGISRGGS